MHARRFQQTNITYWLEGLVAGFFQGALNAGLLALFGLALGVSVSWLTTLVPIVSVLSANALAGGSMVLVYAMVIDFGACLLGGGLGGALFGLVTRGTGVKDSRPVPTRLKELNTWWHSSLPAGVRAVLWPTLFLVFVVGVPVFGVVAGLGLAFGLGTLAPVLAYVVPFGIYILNGVFAGLHARHTWTLKP